MEVNEIEEIGNEEVVDEGLDQDQGIEVDQSEQTLENNIEREESQDKVTPEPEAASKFSGKQIQDAIKTAIAQNPEQAAMFKKLQDAYFRNQTFEKAFPSAAEANNVKQLLDDIGGVEGIENLQQNAQAYQQQDDFLRDGNPQVLDALFNDFPEGVAKLAPRFLDKLAESNEKEYATAIYPHAIGLMHYSDFPKFLDAMSSETDPARMQQLVQNLKGWWGSQLKTAQDLYKGSKAEPVKDTKLTQREQALSERETQINAETFRKGIATHTTPILDSQVNKYVKMYNLAESQVKIFKQHLTATIDEEQANDAIYQKQYNIRANTPGMTVDKLSKFVSDDLNRRLRERTFDVVKSIYGTPKGGVRQQVTNTPKAGVAKTTSSGGPIKINEKPEGKHVDWDKPDAQLLWVASKAWMKSGPYAGKFVSWSKVN